MLCCAAQVLTETFNWIRTAVSDFLLPAFNVKCLIDWAKEGLGSANSATRTAAVQLLGTLHAFLGPPLGDMVRPLQCTCHGPCASAADFLPDVYWKAYGIGPCVL